MSDWLPDRLPEDIDAERSFLATCCAPGAGYVASEAVSTMREDDFVHPAHRAVFSALTALLAAQEEIHSLSLKDRLESAGTLHKVGGYSGLVELLAGEDVERPMALADIIRRKAKLRRLVHLGAKLVRQAAEEENDPSGLIGPLMTEAEELIASDRKATWEKAGSSAIALVERQGFLTDDPKDRADGRSVFGIGLPVLDRVMKRLKRNMVVIAARAKCGKTTLMCQSAWKQAREGHVVGICSGEMTQEEVKVVLISHALGMDQDAVAAGNFMPEQWRRLEELQPTLDNIWIYAFEPETPWVQIEATCRRAINQYGLDTIYLDYFSLVGKPPGQFFNEAARAASLSKRMKALPKSTGIVFVVLVQINRDPGDDSEPGPSNIRESGQIEQDMGIGIFLWRQPCKDLVRIERGEKWDYWAKVDMNRFGPSYVKTEVDLQGAIATMRERTRETETNTTYQAAACAPGGKKRHAPPQLDYE